MPALATWIQPPNHAAKKLKELTQSFNDSQAAPRLGCRAHAGSQALNSPCAAKKLKELTQSFNDKRTART
jgi:hypothetical protein